MKKLLDLWGKFYGWKIRKMVKYESDVGARCRACFVEEPEMHYLFSDVDHNLKLADILHDTTNFNVVENDKMPPYLCKKCTTLVVDFYNFKMVYKQKETYLKSILKSHEKPEEIIIKTELDVNEIEVATTNLYSDNKKVNFLEKNQEEENVIEEQIVAEYVTPEELFSENATGETFDTSQSSQDDDLEMKEYLKYNCEKCDEWFVVLEAFQEHVGAKHEENPADWEKCCRKSVIKVSVPVKRQPTVLPQPVRTGLFRRRKRRRVNHEENGETCAGLLEDVMGSEGFSCRTCKEEFSNAFELRQHSKQHKNFICEQCGAAFRRKSDLDDHREVHTNVRKFRCNYCEKSFKTMRALRNHTKIHTNPRQIICELCGQRFTHKTTMKTHVMLKHVGARNFTCSVCGLSFPLKQTLEKHVSRKHQGIRELKFSCKQCHVAYMDKSSLKRHVLTRHTEGYVPPTCHVCGKQLSSENRLRKHIGQHEKDFGGDTKEPKVIVKRMKRSSSSGSSTSEDDGIDWDEIRRVIF